MRISFYKINDDPKTVSKSLPAATVLTGTVRGDIDVIKPDIIVNTDVSDYNYMYISDFDRYYFINGCTIERTGVYHVEGVHVDVLMTYRLNIQATYAIIDKTSSATLANKYIDDGSLILSQKVEQNVANFQTGFSTSNFQYVLVTAGGRQSVSSGSGSSSNS